MSADAAGTRLPKGERFTFVSFRGCLGAIGLSSLVLAAAVFAIDAAEPGTERSSIAVEALRRLKGIDLEANPSIKAAVLKVLDSTKGTPDFVEIVRDFKLKDQSPALLELALRNATNTTGADAARLVLENGGADLFEKTFKSADTNSAISAAVVLGAVGGKQIVSLLQGIVMDAQRDLGLRKQALKSLAGTHEGAATLLQFAKDGKLPAALGFLASTELNNVRWPNLKAQAAELLPLAPSANAQPLPSISELVKMKGTATRGEEVFARPAVGCINCHQINGKGMDFGPKLSEIGTKLGKDALFEAILDPSAGISFGYEAWQIELKNGDDTLGLIVSETGEELAVKTQSGIITRYPKAQIAKRRKMETSIMPAGIQQAMSIQDLVDLVDYLSSLKKAESP